MNSNTEFTLPGLQGLLLQVPLAFIPIGNSYIRTDSLPD